jgi:hypothetical protein
MDIRVWWQRSTWGSRFLTAYIGGLVLLAGLSVGEALTQVPWVEAWQTTAETWHARPWRPLTTLEQCQGEAAVAADWSAMRTGNVSLRDHWYRSLVATCLEARLRGPAPR